MLDSNMLFLDSEYKADCEYKINYIDYLNKISNSTGHNNIDDLRNMITTKLYIDDGSVLHRTKLISMIPMTDTNKSYYKIILELDNCKEIHEN